MPLENIYTKRRNFQLWLRKQHSSMRSLADSIDDSIIEQQQQQHHRRLSSNSLRNLSNNPPSSLFSRSLHSSRSIVSDLNDDFSANGDEEYENEFLQGSDSNSIVSFSSKTANNTGKVSYQNCKNIDEALCNLYHHSSSSNNKNRHSSYLSSFDLQSSTSDYSYDWLLDGVDDDFSDTEDNDGNRDADNNNISASENSTERRQFITNNQEEENLNSFLNVLELEETPQNSFALDSDSLKKGSYDDGNTSEDEWGEFTDAASLTENDEDTQQVKDLPQQALNGIHDKSINEHETKDKVQRCPSPIDTVNCSTVSTAEDPALFLILDEIGESSAKAKIDDDNDIDDKSVENDVDDDDDDDLSEVMTPNTLQQFSFSSCLSFQNCDDLSSSVNSSSKNERRQTRANSMDRERPNFLLSRLKLPKTDTLEGRFTRRIMELQRQTIQEENYLGEELDEEIDYYDEIRDEDSSAMERDNKKWWQKTDQTMEKELPDEYYLEDFDPIIPILKMLPSSQCAIIEPPTPKIKNYQRSSSMRPPRPEKIEVEDNDSNNKVSLVLEQDEFISQKLSEMDLIHKRIQERLSKRIQSRFDKIVYGMKRTLDIDIDICTAHMFCQMGRRQLDLAKLHAQVDSTVDTLKLANKKSTLEKLDQTFSACEEVLQEEKDILQFQFQSSSSSDQYENNIDFESIIQRVCALREKVYNDPVLNQLDCLAEMRARLNIETDHNENDTAKKSIMKGLIERVEQHWLQTFIQECCSLSSFADSSCTFDSTKYKTILNARHQLQAHIHEKTENKSGTTNDKNIGNDAANGIVKIIISTLRTEISRALVESMLFPSSETTTLPQSPLQQPKISILHYKNDELSNIIHKTLLYESESGDGKSENLTDATPNDSNTDSVTGNTFNALELYQQFCTSVSTVLHIFHQIIEWHEYEMIHSSSIPLTGETAKNQQELYSDIYQLIILEGTEEFFTECYSYLYLLLDYFLKVYKPKQKGQKWDLDLQALQNTLLLTNALLKVHDEKFTYNITDNMTKTRKNLVNKVEEVMKRYLRSVHVWAMNDLAEMLPNEKWLLREVNLGGDMDQNNESMNNSYSENFGMKKGISNLLKRYIPKYSLPDSSEILSCFDRLGVNFPETKESEKLSHNLSHNQAQQDPVKSNESDSCNIIYSLMKSFNGTASKSKKVDDHNIERKQDCCLISVATHSALHGICKWTARIMVVLEKLPIVAPHIEGVLTNIYDLYFLTVFRLCADTSKNEEIILDGYKVKPESYVSYFSSLSSSLSASGRQENSILSSAFSPYKKTKRRSATFTKQMQKNFFSSNNIEAEICSPLKCDFPQHQSFRKYTHKSQKSLKAVVNLDKIKPWTSDEYLFGMDSLADSDSESDSDDDIQGKRSMIGKPIFNQNNKDVKRKPTPCSVAASALMKRCVAAQSCLFVAAVLDAALSNIPNVMQEQPGLFEYKELVVKVAPDLASRSTRMATLRALRAGHIVSEIIKIGVGWEESILNEHSNDYIDFSLIDRCASIWFYMVSSIDGLHPTAHKFLSFIWEHMVRAGFESLLEGFSKITTCSTEGRALMSMDLASFASGIQNRSIMNRIKQFQEEFKLPKTEESFMLLSPSLSQESQIISMPRGNQGMQYVDIYVKVFYFDVADVMKWIEDNYKNYHLSHSLALMSSVVAGRSTDGNTIQELNQMCQKVADLYATENNAS